MRERGQVLSRQQGKWRAGIALACEAFSVDVGRRPGFYIDFDAIYELVKVPKLACGAARENSHPGKRCKSGIYRATINPR